MLHSRRGFLGASASLVGGTLLAPSASHAQEDAPLPVVDCHVHFYDPTRPQGVPWPDKNDRVLYRITLPKQFREQAAVCGVSKAIAVECSPRVDDNDWLIELAGENPEVLGIVGNLTPGTDAFADQVKRYSRNDLFRGIRLNHKAVHEGLDRPEFLADLRRMAELDRGLDINGGPDMLVDAARLASLIPSLTIVLNHLGNVDIDGAEPPKPWVAGLRAAARHPRVFCKVSALVEHARPKSGDRDVPLDVDFYRPTLDAAWAAFGDDRLIFGSNWPVSDRFAPYTTVYTIIRNYVRGRGRIPSEKFFAQNAQVAYRWPKA